MTEIKKKQDVFQTSVQMNQLLNVGVILNDSSFVPTNKNYILSYASKTGYTKMVGLLLKDGRFNPVGDRNSPILSSYYRGFHEIVTLLFKYKKVRDILEKNNNKIYNIVKNLNKKELIQQKVTAF